MAARQALAARLLAVAVAVLAVAWVWSRQWPKCRLLRERGSVAYGVVTAKSAGRARLVNYTFSAADRLYSGVGRAGYGNPEFSELAVDDRVLIFYLPTDPDVSLLGDPAEHLRDQNRIIIWSLTFAAVVAFVSFSGELKKAGTR
jgi:hypothetical protein